MSKSIALLFVLVFLTSSCITIIKPAGASAVAWTTKAPMPTARSHFGVAVVNGKIYAMGGENNESLFAPNHTGLNTSEEYDPATDTWITKKPMPTPRSDFGIAVYQNKIYVIGGSIQASVATGANEVYDPAADKWETKASMPTSRERLSANTVNGKIYAIGGNTHTIINDFAGLGLGPADLIEFSEKIEVYDPVSDSWTTQARPMPHPVSYHASAVINNKICVIGGGDPSLQIYNPETDTWSLGQPVPIKVEYPGAAATAGIMAPKRVYLIGGQAWLPTQPATNFVQIYNPEVDNWTKGLSMPTNRSSIGLVVLNDTLYAIGGESITNGLQFFNKNEQYTPIGYGKIPEPFPTTLIAAASGASVAVIGIGLIVYFKKRGKGRNS